MPTPNKTLARLIALKREKAEQTCQRLRLQITAIEREIASLISHLETIDGPESRFSDYMVTHGNTFVVRTISKIESFRAEQSTLRNALVPAETALRITMHAEEQIAKENLCRHRKRD